MSSTKYAIPFCNTSFHFLSVIWCTKLFNFNEVHFINFLKSVWCYMRKFTHMFSSKSYIVSALMFRVEIHFEFISVMWDNGLNSSICMWVSGCSYHLLNRLSFPEPLNYLSTFVEKSADHKYKGWFLDSQFCSLNLC